MSYKYVTGSVRRGDIYYEDDRQGAQTYIDFGYDSIALRPSGSAILYAQADAIGIGTTNPGCELHVAGEDARVRIDGDTDSHPGLELSENGTRKWIVFNDYTNDNLTFKTNSNIRMSIQQDGNVGIGVTDPDTLFEVGGAVHLSGEIATPSAPADGDGGILYPKTDGKLYWRSHELGETDLTSGGGGGGGSTNSFSTISVSGEDNVVADSATDTLTLVAGTNTSITTNAGADTITFNSVFPKAHIEGLTLTYVDDDNIQIGTGECRNGANTADMTLGTAQNIDITASGINGLDAGSVSDATWYSVWLVSGTSGTGGLYSTSADSPTLPAGYDVSKRRIGWIKTYQTAIPVFVQTGGGRERTYYWGEASGFYNLHTNVQDTTGWQTDYSMAAGTAPTAHTMLVTMQASAGGTNSINWRWQGYADMGAGFTISQLAQTILEYDTMVPVPCIDNSGVNMNIRIKTWSTAKATIRTAGWIETI